MKAASRVLLGLRLLGVATCVMFLLSVFTPLWNVLAQRLAVEPVIQPADAVVVLGGGADEEDKDLNDASLRRATAAMRLYGRGLAPILVLCGPEGEAQIRQQTALELGLENQKIILITEAMTTRAESEHSAAALMPRGARTILLVTESLHMRRAKLLFERVGFVCIRPPPITIQHRRLRRRREWS